MLAVIKNISGFNKLVVIMYEKSEVDKPRFFNLNDHISLTPTSRWNAASTTSSHALSSIR